MKHRLPHIALLIFAFLTLIMVAAVYSYMYHLVGMSSERLIVARQAVETAKSDKDNSQGIISLYTTTAPVRAQLPSLFISSDKAVSFIESMESLGRLASSSASLTAIQADNLDGAPAGKIGAIRGHMDATGSWSSLMRTLSLAETLPYVARVSSARLDVSSAGSEKLSARTWHISFDVEAALRVASSTLK